VPENRWTQAIEVDPGGHMTRSGTGHNRTITGSGGPVRAKVGS
jgi:hypothetical protein